MVGKKVWLVADALTDTPPIAAKTLSVDLGKSVVLGNVSPCAAEPHGIDSVKKRVAEMVGDKVHVSA